MKRFWVVPYSSTYFWTVWDSRSARAVEPPGGYFHGTKRRARSYARTLNKVDRLTTDEAQP